MCSVVYSNYIVYIDDSGTRIIKYNPINQKKKVIFESASKNKKIEHYHVSDDNIIVAIAGENKSIIWRNGKKVISHYTLTGFCSLRRLQTRNGNFVVVSDGFTVYVYDFNGKSYPNYFVDSRYDISACGRYIIMIYSGYLFRIAAYKLDYKLVFDKPTGNSIIQIKDCEHLYWITDSKRIITFRSNDECFIANVKTGKIKKYDNEFIHQDHFDTGNNYVFGSAFRIEMLDVKPYIIVYNAGTLDSVKIISNEYAGIMVHNNKLGVFIDYNYNCFRIVSKQIFEFELQKVVFGKNYIKDSQIIQSPIMEMVLHYDMIFDLLPLELLCIELYDEILNYCW